MALQLELLPEDRVELEDALLEILDSACHTCMISNLMPLPCGFDKCLKIQSLRLALKSK